MRIIEQISLVFLITAIATDAPLVNIWLHLNYYYKHTSADKALPIPFINKMCDRLTYIQPNVFHVIAHFKKVVKFMCGIYSTLHYRINR